MKGGRHKVIGSKRLAIPPQTSTIASHLPKAVGAAFSIGIARRLGMTGLPLPDDAVVLTSFGDASANHSTAQGAFNTAGRSEEHTSELQSLMRISYAVFCLKKTNKTTTVRHNN